MSIKRVAVLILAAIVSLSLLAGCNKQVEQKQEEQQQSQNSTSQAETKEAEFAKKLEITWLGANQRGMIAKDNSMVKDKLEEMFNITIKNVEADIYNKEQLNLMLASGVEADVIFKYDSDVDFMASTGTVRSIDEKMIEENAPYIYSQIKKISPDGSWKLVATANDELYMIPFINTTAKIPYGMAVRSDWLKNVGYDKMPETLEELEALLLKFRNNDPDRNDKKDTYAITKFSAQKEAIHELVPYVFGAYGVALGGFMVDEDGSPKYFAVDENYKKALKVAADWYKKGIIDPEAPLDGRAEFEKKYVSGKIGVMTQVDAWANKNSNTPIAKLLEKEPAAEPVYLKPVKGPDGTALTQQSGDPIGSYNGNYFGKNTSDEKVARILKMFDAMESDKDLWTFCFYGNVDEHFTFNKDGAVVPSAVLTDEVRTNIGSGRYVLQSVLELAAFYRTDANRLAARNEMKEFGMVPRHSYVVKGPAETEVWASLQKIEQEFFWKALTGDLNIDTEWDSYVSKWNNAGGEKMMKEKKEGWERFKSGK